MRPIEMGVNPKMQSFFDEPRASFEYPPMYEKAYFLMLVILVLRLERWS